MSYQIPVQTADGKYSLLECVGTDGPDQYGIRMQTADGKTALIKVVPASTDQYCIRAQTADGKIVLVSPAQVDLGILYSGFQGTETGINQWSGARTDCNADDFNGYSEGGTRSALVFWGLSNLTIIGRGFLTGNFASVSGGNLVLAAVNDDSIAYNATVIYSITEPATGNNMLSWSTHGTFNIAAGAIYSNQFTYDVSSLLPSPEIYIGIILTPDKNDSGYPDLDWGSYVGVYVDIVGFNQT